MSIEAKCTVCGKDFTMDDKWAGFVKKYPDRVKCPNCMKGKSTEAKQAKAAETSKKVSVASKSSAGGKEPVNAQMFRKAYDEILAEFADVKDDVAPYIGGWVSTIVINRSK